MIRSEALGRSSVRPALVKKLLSQKRIWIYSDDAPTTNQGKLPTRGVTFTPPQEIIQRAEHAERQERPADYVVCRL